MILKDIDYLVTQNERRQILRDIDVRVEEKQIKQIHTNLDGTGIVDCSGMAVLPGLINAHTHMELAARRGISNNKPLFEWFDDLNVDALTGEWKRYAISVSLIELLRTGTTCVNDCYNTDPETIAAVEHSGIRAVLSSYLRDDGERDEVRATEQLSDAMAFHDTVEEVERITPALGPHSIYNCTPEFLKRISKTAADLDSMIHIHLAETEAEQDECFDAYGKSPVEHLKETNVLAQDVVVAHCVHIDESDLRLLVENEVGVAHCPCSNMKLGSGRFRLPVIADRLPIGIGTDGVASNNNLNAFEEAKIASLYQKERDPSAATAQQLLDHLTIEGAVAIGKSDEIGSIVPGKRADLIFIDLDDTTLTPRNPELLVSHLIFSFNGPVKASMVDGEFVVKDGTVTGLDRREAIEGLGAALAKSPCVR